MPSFQPAATRIAASRAKVAALQETATIRPTSAFASSFTCASAPARGGSEDDGVKPFQLGGEERAPKEVARLGLDGLEAARLAQGLRQRGDGRRIGIDRAHLRLAREPQREGADTAEQVGDALRLAGALQHQAGQHVLAGRRRLQEGAGRQRHGQPVNCDDRHLALHDEVAMIGEADEAGRIGGVNEGEPLTLAEAPGAAQFHVEPLRRGGHLDVQRLADALQRCRDHPRGGQGFGE